jgi:uncharacterized membrane protein
LPDKELPSGDAEPPGADEGSPNVNPEVLDAMPEGSDAYQVAGEVIHQSVSFRQAPYPTPADLREYEEIQPGFTDRILTLTERETEHRIQQERFQDRATFDLAKRGQTCAFIVVMALVLGGIAAILTDHSIVGFAGLILAAATLAGAFVAPNIRSRRSGANEENLPGTEIEKPAEPTAGGSEGSST